MVWIGLATKEGTGEETVDFGRGTTAICSAVAVGYMLVVGLD